MSGDCCVWICKVVRWFSNNQVEIQVIGKSALRARCIHLRLISGGMKLHFELTWSDVLMGNKKTDRVRTAHSKSFILLLRRVDK